MNTLPISAAARAAPAALLKIAGLNLLLPQSDIRTVESVADIDTTEPELCSAGWINYAQKRWPVYCLSEDLGLLSQVSSSRRACVMVAVGDDHIGILSDDVIIMRQLPERQYELPVPMRLPGSPLRHLLAIDDDIVCVTDARLLAEHIARLNTGGICGC